MRCNGTDEVYILSFFYLKKSCLFLIILLNSPVSHLGMRFHRAAGEILLRSFLPSMWQSSNLQAQHANKGKRMTQRKHYNWLLKLRQLKEFSSENQCKQLEWISIFYNNFFGNFSWNSKAMFEVNKKMANLALEGLTYPHNSVN